MWDKIIDKSYSLDLLKTVAGGGILRVFGLLISLFLANYAGTEYLGIYAFCKTLVLNLGIITTFGQDLVVNRLNSSKDYSKKSGIKSLYSSFKLSLILFPLTGLILLFFAEEIKDLTNNKLNGATIILICFSGFLNSTNKLIRGWLTGNSFFDKILITDITHALSSIILVLILYKKFGLEGAVLSIFAAEFVSIILLITFLPKPHYLNFSAFVDSITKKIFFESLPLGAMEIIGALKALIISILIVRTFNVEEYSIYTVALQIGSILTFLPGTLRNINLNYISKDLLRIQNTTKKAVLINTLSTLIIGILIMIMLPLIIKLYGLKFSSLWMLVPIQIVMSVFISISTILGAVLISKEKGWRLFNYRLIRESVTILSIYLISLMVNLSGAMSAILALTFGELIYLLSLPNKYNAQE